MSSPADRAAAARAAARSSWRGAKTTLSQLDHEEDLSASTTVEERLAMMWELALASWSLAGLPLPSYSRSDMPGRVLRPEGR